ncbi:outer membrane protein Omp85 [Candidatus Scalindua japonica]|uniref:Outer membrane protein assembly factor BamA n=1 Tax=Candidatus Scalindua japonica TaxID=1284222 RepID=A0A286U235_9BACT|nr:outer membrane protein assembly factor BamA [Candidatus Scalindua japonica]GAX62194.1 outer membrane protein Omp85 [Candidatus Scalindua japonica]
MLQKYIITFAIVFVFFLSLDSNKPLNAQGSEAVSAVVKKIEFKGNDRISSSTIKAAIKTNHGDIYDPKAISQDVDAIWLLGFFDNIEVEVESYEDGVKVIFLVLERPVIKNIFFAGNGQVKTKKLREAIQVREGDYLKRYLIKLDEDKIREMYQKMGFSHIVIKSEEKKSNGYVDITYKIREGSKVYIKEIVFEGNKTFSSKRLTKIMDTKKRKFPSLVFPGKFDKAEFEGDIDNIKAFYGSGGWLDTDIKWKERYSPDKTKMFLYVVIDEGDRYHVDTVNIKGNKLFTSEEIMGMLQLKKGSAFLPELLQKDSKGIRMAYGRQGHLNADVRANYSYKQVEPKIDITFDIIENERFFIEKVIVSGNDKTKDNVIRRNLSFFPGERLDTQKIKGSEQRLAGTGYFDNQSGKASEISYVPGTEYNTKNVIVDVKEGRTGMMRFGGGFGANAGLFGDVSYTDKNFDIFDFPKDLRDFMSGNAFRGGGHTITLRFSPGLQRTEGMFSYSNPAVFDSGYSLGLSTNIFRRAREDYDEERKGAKVSVGKTVLRGLRLGVTPNFEVIGVQNIDSNAPLVVKDIEGSNKKLSLELSAMLDRRDSRMFPTKGYKITSSLVFSGLDVDIIKFSVQGKKHTTVFNFSDWRGKHVLSYGGTLGVIEATSDQGVPIFERFFAGGANSIRGFAFRGVGPVDVTSSEQVGGKVLLLASAEYTLPVYGDMVRGAFFVDAGKADTDLNDLNINNIRATIGFGFRAKVPFMGNSVVAVDFGFPFIRKDSDDEQAVTFNFGGGR